MSDYLGDFTPGKTIRTAFSTSNPSDGSPITLAGSPSIAVYKDSNTTESTAGITLSVDFDAKTGSHRVAIDTSADGAFYAAGSDFFIQVVAGTAGGISIAGLVLGQFSIANRSALRPTTADRTIDVTAAGLANLNTAQTGWTVRDVSAVADNQLTTSDLWISAYAAAAGDATIVGTTLTRKTASTATTVVAKTLDSATTPTSMT